jgi:hypothetical protein
MKLVTFATFITLVIFVKLAKDITNLLFTAYLVIKDIIIIIIKTIVIVVTSAKVVISCHSCNVLKCSQTVIIVVTI